MCGLLAVSNVSRDFDGLSKSLESLRNLRHRGPDGTGYSYIDNVFLGHTRLSIIDLDLGKQPLLDATNRYEIIFNGEIFNYLELRQYLTIKNYQFRTKSDTEVLLNLFIEFGIKGLKKIDGFFSFVIYDRLEKLLWFSRDRFGIKPLYVLRQKNQLILASEIKAINLNSRINLDITDEKMDEYIIYGYLSGGKTLYSNISEAQPGVLYKYELSDDIHTKYEWFDVLTFTPETDFRDSDDNWNSMSDSINLWARSDVPISLLLSGGIDSSLIALSLKHKDVLAYNLVPSSTSFFSEYDSALAVANVCNMRLAAVSETECEIATYLDFMSKFDSPIIDTNYWSLANLCSSIKQDGIKVTICGDGSDELFGGYDRHIKYARILANSDMNLEAVLQENHLSVSRLSRLKKSRTVQAYPEERINWLERTRGLAPLERILRMDQKGFLGAYLRRQDEVGMLYSLEVRTPYLSNSIFELSRSITSKTKIEISGSGIAQKAFLKRILKHESGIEYNPGKKLHFNSFLMTSNRPISRQIIHYFSNKSLTIWDYIEQDKLLDMISQSSSMETPGHDNTIFRILSLTNFLDKAERK